MTEDEATRFSAAWVTAWSNRDLAAILECYADGAALTSPLAARRFRREDGTVRGRNELREYFAIGLAAAPNLRIDRPEVFAGVDGVTILYERENGAAVAEVMLLDEHGKVRRAHVFYRGLLLPEWPPD